MAMQSFSGLIPNNSPSYLSLRILRKLCGFIANLYIEKQINESDYLGVTISGDNDLDYKSISAKYFMKLNQGQYFISELKYQDGKHNDYWAANVNYYFDDKTSVSAMYDDNDNYRVGVKHFFNNNVALSAGYGANTDESDYDVVDVNLTLQF